MFEEAEVIDTCYVDDDNTGIGIGGVILAGAVGALLGAGVAAYLANRRSGEYASYSSDNLNNDDSDIKTTTDSHRVLTYEDLERLSKSLKEYDEKKSTAFTEVDIDEFVTNKRECLKIDFLKLTGVAPKNCEDLFCDLDECFFEGHELDLSELDTSNTENMAGMFFGCTNLAELDLSTFNTVKVKDMNNMFRNCSNLESIDLSSFETRNTLFMQGMFAGCNSLKSLDITEFDTRNVVNMRSMFLGCSQLSGLDLSKLNTTNVKDLNQMLRGCDISTFSLPIDRKFVEYESIYF